MSSARTKRLERARALGLAILLLVVAGGSHAADVGDAGRGSGIARINPEGDASEQWDFFAQLESGHHVFVRYAITNEGPGWGTAYVVGHLVTPDGRKVYIDKGNLRGGWELSGDRRYMRVGDNEIDLRGPVHRIVIDRSGFVAELRFAAPTTPATVQDPSEAFRIDLLHAAVPFEGELRVRGEIPKMKIRGTLASTHSWVDETPTKVGLSILEFFSLSQGAAVYLSSFLSPEGVRSHRLILERHGETLLETTDFSVAARKALDTPFSDGYPVPRFLEIEGPEVSGRIALTSVLTSDSPLDLIPNPFRWFLRWKMDPRRLWAASPFELRIRSKASGVSDETISGEGVAALVFAKPVPDGLEGADEPR